MMPRLLILTILLATLLGGCARNRYEPPKRADHTATSAAGKRVIITDSNGQPTLKIRARKNAWKVYDKNFQAAGFVRWPDKSAPHIENLIRKDLAKFQTVGNNDEVFELPGHLRIEKIDHGWAVFDQDAKLLGLFEHHSSPEKAAPDLEILVAEVDDTDTDTEIADVDSNEKTDSDESLEVVAELAKLDEQLAAEQWTLRSDYNSSILWTASQQGKFVIARHKDGKSFTSNAAHFSAPALLASELVALSELERAALAVWFMHMMPDA